MSAKDAFHNVVRDALVAEGWTITHDPFRLSIGRRNAFVDLAAEMPFAAQMDGRKIAVEVKSFLGASALDDLENALGQYGVYRAILSLREPERTLYLAVPLPMRDLLLDERDFRHILKEFDARLIFFSATRKEPLEWIEPLSFER
jgi:hypothetical protein